MKLQFKALTITLGLVALLGACTSVNSSTPSVGTPSVESSVELTPDGAEVKAPELGSETGDMETPDLEAEASDELGSETAGIDTPGLSSETDNMETPGLEAEAADELDSETAEIEAPGLEASEEVAEPDTAEIGTPEVEATETEKGSDLESNAIPLQDVEDGGDDAPKAAEVEPELEPAQ